jgi:hypothetical protein
MSSKEMSSDTESFDEEDMYGLDYSMEAVSESSDGGEEDNENTGQVEIEMVCNLQFLTFFKIVNLVQNKDITEMLCRIQTSVANLSALTEELCRALDIDGMPFLCIHEYQRINVNLVHTSSHTESEIEEPESS